MSPNTSKDSLKVCPCHYLLPNVVLGIIVSY